MATKIELNDDDMVCANCAFFVRLEGEREMLHIGQCHRNPPAVLQDEDGDPYSVFPLVEDAAWCGEMAWKAH